MVAPSDLRPSTQEIQALFDRIAPVYDELNQTLSLGFHRVWKRMAVLWSGAEAGDCCVDVCCGSGDLALMLAQQVGVKGQVYGVDFSAQQLAIAQQRSESARLSKIVAWKQADALDLPFEAAKFDAVTMGYGLRNLTDIPQGLAELRRVLKPNGTAAILDFHRPSNPLMQQFQQWYLDQVVVPAAERYGLPDEYAYIAPSVDRFPTGQKQVALALEAGFSQAVHYPIAGGMMGVLVAAH
ncbi:bifunctional demethylmenaquinone methyltransferase/2-methoxy-6-polyprenyl-1,4-benzoquinol methylase UbiE [Pseudanabaena sp. FACHB-2040]|uniref:bifunctional demethylmenaquinone methyltransferase/2-methoxy-6-polyprenyl-1,4-benzoquinol methylase UbiE n=1 Tax=Pseudanabaena sp. FACHB-2040 TaxID=2692859 RepID=UPI0016856F8C|nr:bifunctional demethylmenaquinone methyltransferase/2-methoxy-6-polyprenyl-1,4-benzoquinol methylase UbiE [Pseudanabaena sp. FACHB-2040]MBD2257118.1 bifunctional demethylmenaquinone methyltransferase/2-methoxy-6-polyprenyl-1,4-benzoquinol methylase UbiE [Pseudanabaena sp. FACHB-2040]